MLHYQAGYTQLSLHRPPLPRATTILTLSSLSSPQGSWGGAGLTKPPPKPERIKHFPGIDPSKRQDAGKPHVIISEKKDKKAEKYLVTDLPFPYTSKAQFERRMEVPLGMEWNTRKGFQRGTIPRVTKKVIFWIFLFLGGGSGVLNFLLMPFVVLDRYNHRPFGEAFLIVDCHVPLLLRVSSDLGPCKAKRRPPRLVTAVPDPSTRILRDACISICI